MATELSNHIQNKRKPRKGTQKKGTRKQLLNYNLGELELELLEGQLQRHHSVVLYSAGGEEGGCLAGLEPLLHEPSHHVCAAVVARAHLVCGDVTKRADKKQTAEKKPRKKR